MVLCYIAHPLLEFLSFLPQINCAWCFWRRGRCGDTNATALRLPGNQLGKCHAMIFAFGLGPCCIYLCLQGYYVCPCVIWGGWDDLICSWHHVCLLKISNSSNSPFCHCSFGLGFWGRVSLWSPGWPLTHCPPDSASWEFEPQACATCGSLLYVYVPQHNDILLYMYSAVYICSCVSTHMYGGKCVCVS